MEAVGLGGEGADEIIAAGDQFGETATGRIGGRGGFEFKRVSHLGEDAGIDLVGFGETARGAGAVAGLLRIDRA